MTNERKSNKKWKLEGYFACDERNVLTFFREISVRELADRKEKQQSKRRKKKEKQCLLILLLILKQIYYTRRIRRLVERLIK